MNREAGAVEYGMEWRTESNTTHGDIAVEVRKRPGKTGRRQVIARKDGLAFHSEFVAWNVWEGHCGGHLWIPKFVARAQERWPLFQQARAAL